MKDLESMLKALAEETRLRILALIFRHGTVCVCEVEGLLGITQSKASRHLRYMANAGVLEAERDGVIMNYRLPERPSPELAAMLTLLRGLLAARGAADPGAEAGALVQIRMARSGASEPAGAAAG
jgi:ArsR family transcriptional regulator